MCTHFNSNVVQNGVSYCYRICDDICLTDLKTEFSPPSTYSKSSNPRIKIVAFPLPIDSGRTHATPVCYYNFWIFAYKVMTVGKANSKNPATAPPINDPAMAALSEENDELTSSDELSSESTQSSTQAPGSSYCRNTYDNRMRVQTSKIHLWNSYHCIWGQKLPHQVSLEKQSWLWKW